MKASDTILLSLLFFSIGVVMGVHGFKQSTDAKEKDLRTRIKKHQTVIDSLRKDVFELRKTLNEAKEKTTIETIKYYEIKPNANSVPYLDSMFRSRYN
jgi:sensor domain CHASE-containing protein